jgi:hypothetical protein
LAVMTEFHSKSTSSRSKSNSTGNHSTGKQRTYFQNYVALAQVLIWRVHYMADYAPNNPRPLPATPTSSNRACTTWPDFRMVGSLPAI